jgi:hypothetical protein
MTDRDERIRELASFLWLEDGRPEGEAERHWLAAPSSSPSLLKASASNGSLPRSPRAISVDSGDGEIDPA